MMSTTLGVLRFVSRRTDAQAMSASITSRGGPKSVPGASMGGASRPASIIPVPQRPSLPHVCPERQATSSEQSAVQRLLPLQ